MGFTLEELDQITTGQVFDMMIESLNDYEGEYSELPTQEDFNNF